MEQLSSSVAASVAAGDLEAARIAHEAIGKLLGAASTEPGAVIDLASARPGRNRTR